MKIKICELRKLIRNLLIVESTTEEMGVFVDDDIQGAKEALLYSTKTFVDGMKSLLKGKDEENYDLDFDQITEILKSSAKGMIQISQPSSDAHSNGAWEVTAVAGPGKTIYGVGYEISPENALIPDRNSVSDAAKSAWKKQFDSGRKKKKIDDLDKPLTPTKDDDGHVHNDSSAPWLDYSYWGNGENFNMLMNNHKHAMSEVVKLLMPWYKHKNEAYVESSLNSTLSSVAQWFFGSKYYN